MARSVRSASLESVAAAVAEEAGDLCDELGVMLDEHSQVDASTATHGERKDASTRTCHRFARNDEFDLASARRIVVLRDRRLGRRTAAKRHGGDPRG